LDGFRFVWRTPLILANDTLELFAVLPVGDGTPAVYARDILHVGARALVGCGRPTRPGRW